MGEEVMVANLGTGRTCVLLTDLGLRALAAKGKIRLSDKIAIAIG